MIFVFSYNRKEMLSQILKELEGENPIVLDDGSDFDLDELGCDYVSFEHGGKENFWKIWNHALDLAKLSDDDFFLFTQDDVLQLNIEKIKEIHKSKKLQPYAYHILNSGNQIRWGKERDRKIDRDTIKCGWVDCIFFCNRLLLEKLEFKIQPVPKSRFRNRNISSGVGEQLTKRIHNMKVVQIFKPEKSLGFHGTHESKMHPHIRKKFPLNSR